MRERIEQAIKAALPGVSFMVERPGNSAHGDYSTNAALVGKTDAQALADKLKIEGAERVEVVGKFINFFLTREELVPKEQNIPQLYAGKLVMVEYTSPNLFKPLHIGNLVSTILGEAIARLFEATGAEVKRINYPSDIGPTVAKGVWGLQKLNLDPTDIKQLGQAYAAGSDAYESDESAKKEIEEINRALYENSNEKWSSLRSVGVETSRKHLDALCERLGTKFDAEFFESESGPIGRDIVKANIGEVFEESDGAVVYKGEQDGLHTRVFLNSQGLPTYEAKDVGLFELKRKKYPNFDISITDTGAEQKAYFKVIIAVIKKLFPEVADKELRHSAHATIKLTTGKMSSRKGNVVTGESLLEDLTKAARDREDVAVGAIKYVVLKSGASKDIIFDPEKSLSLEGDSGPYLQYALVRARALLRKAREAGVVEAEGPIGDGRTWPSGPERRPSSALPLEHILVHYSDAVARAAKEMEPHYVTTFLTELAAAFNSWYAQEKVIGGSHQEYGVFLTQAVERTLAQGLQFLGIPTPEEM